jgi:hypothetical protein
MFNEMPAGFCNALLKLSGINNGYVKQWTKWKSIGRNTAVFSYTALLTDF